MARWDNGYVCDVEYTAGFMREMTPGWLAFVALLLGARAPDPAAPLCIADLGCGHAITDAVVAATYPGAEVWAFDLAPAHVQSGRRLAGLAGLSNLHAEERSIAELAQAAPGAWPQFDIITLHGVWSWVSPETTGHIVDFISRFLRPGGLVYVSYNTLAGWASFVPLQRLMHGFAQAQAARSDEVTQAALQLLIRLRDGNAAFFGQNPAAAARLDTTRGVDPRYLAHEYLHASWHPAVMGDVAAALARAKCDYLGSATVADNMPEVSVPEALRPMVNELRDPLLREAVADLATARPFRRDIYCRGAGRLTFAETQDRLDRLRIIGLATAPGPIAGQAITFDCAIGQVTGKPEVYEPLLERLRDGPLSVREAASIPGLRAASLVEVMQAFALLVAGGRAYPLLDQPGDGVAAQRLNLALAGLNALGIDRPMLAAPAIGSAINADIVEVMVVGALIGGAAADPVALADRMVTALARAGRSVLRDGAAIEDPAEARQTLAASVQTIVAERLPLFRQLGIISA